MDFSWLAALAVVLVASALLAGWGLWKGYAVLVETRGPWSMY